MKPVGITLGDPAGIGPEIVARALALPWSAPLRVFGDRGVIERAAAVCKVVPRAFELVEVTALHAAVAGSPEVGAAQVAYLEAALREARAGALSALCTAPIHKAACKRAGFAFPGHTELLAARLSPTEVPLSVTMMLAGPRLRVSLATVHIAVSEVPVALAIGDPIVRAIVQTVDTLVTSFGLARPRVAVCGLNPHAGEAGHFGDEELRLIEPAIERARAQRPGALIVGPSVPDAIFRDAVTGKHDAVVAMYHDQGLIPVKLVDFEEAVNVTLGLPLLRTSPDHGVAYDIAGQGIARPTSFFAALRMACAASSTARER
ncbi:MAG: 4-hydroxythreonine-4-phosphate dehydrogenase PdxA [Polyangia bacterium]